MLLRALHARTVPVLINVVCHSCSTACLMTQSMPPCRTSVHTCQCVLACIRCSASSFPLVRWQRHYLRHRTCALSFDIVYDAIQFVKYNKVIDQGANAASKCSAEVKATGFAESVSAQAQSGELPCFEHVLRTCVVLKKLSAGSCCAPLRRSRASLAAICCSNGVECLVTATI